MADLSGFFQRIQDVKKLQVPAEDVSWIEKHQTPDRSYDLVLYLGCNILRTPHVAQTVIDVFEALDLDFAAVGGSQYCCGVVWDRAGDVSGGQKVSNRTVGRLEDYGADMVVMWCPSCNVHFTDAIYGRDQQQTAFTTTHTPAFLNDLLDRGEIAWRREVPLRVALHTHAGRPDDPTGQERARSDRRDVSRLLERIPGIELVGVVETPEAFNFDCGPIATKLGAEGFAQLRAPVLEPVHDLDIDALVTISHACHREWCDAACEQFDVVNYISLVAQALGLEPRVDTLKQYKAAGTPRAVVAAGQGAWTSHGLEEDDASRLAEKYFGEGKQA